MADEVRISFIGDLTKLDRDVAKAKSQMAELAKQPVVVAGLPAFQSQLKGAEKAREQSQFFI